MNQRLPHLGTGSTHQARWATSQSRSTCRSWSPAAPACSAAPMRDLKSSASSGRVNCGLLDPGDAARDPGSPSAAAWPRCSSGTTRSRRPSSRPARPRRAGARCGSPVRRSRRHVSSRSPRPERHPAACARGCGLELERDVLVLAGQSSAARCQARRSGWSSARLASASCARRRSSKIRASGRGRADERMPEPNRL